MKVGLIGLDSMGEGMSDKRHVICIKCGGKGCEHCNKGWEK